MRNIGTVPLIAVVAFLGARASASAAQNTVSLWRVEVHTDSGLVPSCTVELYGMGEHRRVSAESLGSDGVVEFRDVPAGEYRFGLIDERGQLFYEEYVSVRESVPPLTVRISDRPVDRPPSGPISVKQLQHPPSPKAFQAFVAAQKFSVSKDYARSAEELEKAIRISPDYADAHANLGVQYMRLGRYREALAESLRAIQLGQETAQQYSNLAYAQFALKNYDDAMQSARRSLQEDPGNPRAELLLGVILARDSRTVREAIPHLERAARSMPNVQPLLERVRKTLASMPQNTLNTEASR